MASLILLTRDARAVMALFTAPLCPVVDHQVLYSSSVNV